MLLLDTCTFLWLASDPGRLSPVAQAAMDAEDARLFLSDASIWEVCLKWQAGKIELPTPPRHWFTEQIKIWQTERLAIETEHFYRSSELAAIHRDPFDRLLIAQALDRGFSLVTPDPLIRAYPVAVVW